ncbi:Maltose-binding periplasmic protein precursor [compost metagenome]
MRFSRLAPPLALALTLVVTACAPRSDKLTFATWGSVDEMALLKPLLAGYTAKTGTEVELVHIPESYFQKLPILFASRQAPDVLFLNNMTLPSYADSGALLPLDSRLAVSTSLTEGDYYAQGLEAMRWKGQLYAMPRDLSNLVVYVNRAMFDTAGLPLPQADWTMAQMLDVAHRLSQGNGQERTFGISFDKRPLFWLPYLWSEGGDLFDAGFTRSTLSEPQAVSAMQFYADLAHRHHVAPREIDTGNAPMAQLFAQGKLAMFVSGRWSVPGFRKSLTFDWDVLPFPTGSAGSIVDVDASGWAISAQSPRQDEAWRLIEHLAGKESSNRFSEGGLIVPARRDVAEGLGFLAAGQAPRASRTFLDVLATGRPTRTPPNWGEVTTVLDLELGPLFRGEASASVVLPKAARRIDEVLRQN